MEAEQSLMLVMLSELMDSDDEKPNRWESILWIKRRSVSGYFNSIIREVMIEDRMGFKEMFWMSAEDFEFVLKHIDNNRSLENMCKYSTDVTDEVCWMKTGNYVGWGKKMLDESLLWNKLSSNITFRHPTWSFHFCQILKVFKTIQLFIQYAIISMLDEMLDWLAPAFNFCSFFVYIPEAYLEPSQASMMELFLENS